MIGVDDSTDPPSRSAGVALPEWLAVALVFGTSGAVLVLEILAGRLLAPYVGVNLETFTAIIGTILAGIALGAWAGGVAADRVDPRGLIPFFMVAGGALAIASIPIVRALGGDAGPEAIGLPSVFLALFGFGPSAAVLSAVPPAVIKLQLRDLDETGSTVGRLSAWGTAGAIGGTVLAGYVLVVFAAVTTLIVATGVLLVVSGAAMWFWNRTMPPQMMLSAAGIAVLAVGGVAITEQPCDIQSSYYCVSIEIDPDDDGVRVVVLDDLRHSYVDLDDPTHLEFWYIRRIADAIDTFAPAGPLDVIELGAGGLTIPRWIRATRPGSQQTVLEIDHDLIELIDQEIPVDPELALDEMDDLEVVIGDGRRTIVAIDDGSIDVIVGDAFGSRAVPWHLTTQEFAADLARVLRPGGIYVANIIDGPQEEFLAAEAATLRSVFSHVAVLRGPSVVLGFPGNNVLVASDEPLDGDAWDTARLAVHAESRRDGGELVIDPDELDDYLDGAVLLTDDFAPVDQLIVGAS